MTKSRAIKLAKILILAEATKEDAKGNDKLASMFMEAIKVLGTLK